LIEVDHAVTCRVLRLANSAFYRRSREVSSVRQAVVLLGFNTVRLLALSISAFEAVATVNQSVIEMQDFWLHSFGAAACVRELDSSLGLTDGGLRFTAALLHDVGKCVLAASDGASYGEAIALAASSHRSLASVEAEKFGVDHGQVAAWLCERWNFPEGLVEILRNLPNHATYCGPWRRDVGVVALADHVSRAAGFGNCGDPAESEPDMTLAARVGIDEPTLRALQCRLVASREELGRSLFEWKA
jgi:HD-like signal output (HDOD) protein